MRSDLDRRTATDRPVTWLTSLQSPASDHRVEPLAGLLGDDWTWLGGAWDGRLAAMHDTGVAAGWVCGLLHVSLAATGGWPFQAVAAPAGADGAPVYFGSVVVADRSDLCTFDDLRGATFAFNEESSLSGFRMMVDRLGADGLDLEFFGATVRSGSHRASIDMVVDGRADVAVIDSLVMEDLHPDGVRVIESIGPYPAPPLVARATVAEEVRAAAVAAGWVPVTDDTYAVLRT